MLAAIWVAAGVATEDSDHGLICAAAQLMRHDEIAPRQPQPRPPTLTDAQRLLAEQYGFHAWPDLKAEVDRRQDHAKVADDGLTSQLAHTFDLGAPTEPMRSVAPDDMGYLWSITTDRGRFAARTMDTWFAIVDAETDVTLQNAAAAAGVSLPLPKRSRSGAIVEEVGVHPWRISEWKHGGPPLTAPVDASTTRHIGRILATIHRLALPVDRISPWHAARLAPEPWPEVAQRAAMTRAKWASDLVAKIPDLNELDAVGVAPAREKAVLCHNTLGPAVVRRGRGGKPIVLCWEHAGGQPPGWELCDALVHWTNDPNGGVNEVAARAMAEGYSAVAGDLPPISIESFHGAAISLTNYLYGLTDDALDERDGERRATANRSVHHLLTHLPTRTTFEQFLAAVT